MRCPVKLLTLLIMILPAVISAQDRHKIDSLKQLLIEKPQDTSRVHLYAELSSGFINSLMLPDTATLYADSARVLAEEIGYERGILLAIYNHGLINKTEGDYQQAIDQFQEYVRYHQQLGDSLSVAQGLYNIGVIYNYLGEHVKNIDLQFRILEIFRKADMKMDEANSLYSIGNVHRKTGDYQTALEMYQASILIYRELDLQKKYAMGLFAIGNVHFSTAAYEKAIESYESALVIIKKLDHDRETAFIYMNMGATYEEMDEDELALQYHLEALKLRRTLPYKLNLAHSLDNVGYMYYKMGDYGLANDHFQEALTIAKELGASSEIAEVSQDLSDLYAAQGDFKSAYESHVSSTLIKDSIFTEEKARQISELQTKYKVTQKDQEITLLTKEKEVQEVRAEKQATFRNALIGVIALLAIIAALIFHSMRQRLRNQKILAAKNQEIKVSRLKEELKELEIKALRSQINPHFLFNSLNSINTMILKNDLDDASRYLAKFSKLVRLMLENSEDSKVTLSDELELLNSYVQLESIRFGNKIAYSTKVAESIDPESTYLPSMVLQPFIENAVWHGLLSRKKSGKLTLEIDDRGEQLLCTITDNGVGREASNKLRKQSRFKKKSMGIKITSDRLKLLSNQKGDDLVKITDLKDHNNLPLGTKVNVLIPVS